VTSAPSPAVEDPTPPRFRDRSAVALFAAAAVLAGVVAAVVWRLVVHSPSYVVQPDGSASVTERALTEFFAGDAWFVVIGVVVGAGLGVATRRRFKSLGWLSAFLAAGLGLLAGLVCWWLGLLFSGAPFDERLATAEPGDSVPISLALRSPSALAVWAFAAVTPILLGSALGPDEEAAPRSPRGRKRRARATEVPPEQIVDELGVVRTEQVVDELGVVRTEEAGGQP